ncbi:MAG: prolyl oligopeptidase family serine peptidase [Gemmatimonas sp.]
MILKPATPWREWVALTCAVLAFPLILLGSAAAFITQAYLHFIFTFILGDPQVFVVLLLLAGALFSVVARWLLRAPVVAPRLRLTVVVFATVAICALCASVVQVRLQYSTERVVYTSGDGANAVQLVATLYRPRGHGPFPTIVFVHGSEATLRSRYHGFAERFVKQGYVVLLPDRRGLGESGGVFVKEVSASMLATLAGDIAAGAQFLKSRTDVDATRTGLFGVSQAGWVIPLVLPQAPTVSFAVIMSGPAVSTGEEDRFSHLSGEAGDHFGWKPPPIPFDSINAIAQATRSSGYEPDTSLRAMHVPTLWVYGSWDNSIPVAKSVQKLDSLVAQGNPITVRVFPFGNHGIFVMRGPNKRRLPYYADDLWATVFSWLERRPRSALGV